MTSKNEIRQYYEWLLMGLPASDNYKRRIRAATKSFRDPLEKSLMNEERYYYPPNNWESVYEYGIATCDDETDEEIDAWVRGMERHNASLYDCSGKLCTSWISWKRTPVGIAIVHAMTLDV